MDWDKLAAQVNKSVVKTFRQESLVVYTPISTGVAVEIPLFFESAFFQYDVGTTVSKSSEDPHLFLLESDLGIPPEAGDLLTVRGKNYIVTHGEIDGYGGYKLWLGCLNG